MKYIFFVRPAFFAACIYTLVFSSCTSSYFTTPNNLHKVRATVQFADSSVKTGLLTVNFENVDAANNYIEFAPGASSATERVDFKKIKSYSVGKDVYEAKLLDIHVRSDNHYLFVKRLTPENARLQIYELHQLFKGSDDGNENSEYFISMPGDAPYQATNINSAQLLPFDVKMSAIVADCAPLAQKIRSRQKGYVYSFITFKSQKILVMKRIADEYNTCR